MTYYKQGELDKALVELDKVITIDPMHFNAYIWRGLIQGKEGDFENSINDFKKAIELRPDDETPYYLLGRTYEKAGREIDAGKTYRLYLSRFPAGKRVDQVKSLIKRFAETEELLPNFDEDKTTHPKENKVTEMENSKHETSKMKRSKGKNWVVLLVAAGIVIIIVSTMYISDSSREIDGIRINGLGNDDYFGSDLLAAVARGHTDAVKSLLDAGADFNETGNNGTTALTEAARRGHADIVTILLEAGADANTVTKNGRTVLMMAAAGGHTKVVGTLLKAGANVNAIRDDGVTALMEAALEGHIDIVNILLEAGANVDAKNKYGGTALKIAAGRGHTDLVKILKQAGATE